MKAKIVARPVSEWQSLIDSFTKASSQGKFNLLTLENVLQELQSKFGLVDSSKLDALCKNPVTSTAHILGLVGRKPNRMQLGISAYASTTIDRDTHQIWELGAGIGKSYIASLISLMLLSS